MPSRVDTREDDAGKLNTFITGVKVTGWEHGFEKEKKFEQDFQYTGNNADITVTGSYHYPLLFQEQILVLC